MNVHDAALAWHDAGACVLPAAADGSKRPALAWDRYKTQRPARQELDGWSATTSGIGIVCGNVSGNIEMFEAEAAAVHEGMHTQLMEMLPPDLRDKLNTYVERSPKGGVHWIFRVDGAPVKGNTKLARRAERKPGQQTITVLFETRGEGGWTVIAPSNGPTHPSGKPWQVAIGTAGVIPSLSAEEYRLLHACAATFDAMPTMESKPAAGSAPGPTNNDGAPGSDFNARATWDEILIPAGWTKMRQRGEITDWCRPGKNPRDGGSATTGCHGDWFYVFTTGTEFEPEKTNTKFHTYAILNHHGDESAAGRELRKRGYGAKPEPATRPLQSVPTGGSVTDATPAPEQAPTETPPTWAEIDLTEFLDGTFTPLYPDLFRREDGFCLVYKGKTHSFHGESESGKSWLGLYAIACSLMTEQRAAMVDFESDAHTIVGRLLALGVDPEAIRERFSYRRPEVDPSTDPRELFEWQGLLSQQFEVVVIDGVTDALGIYHCVSVDNDEVTTWIRQVPKMIAWRTGAAVILIDHVTKDADTRGRFAIGAQAKMSNLDGAAYSIEVLDPMGIGMVGRISMRVGKDRNGTIRPRSGPYRKGDRTQQTAIVVLDSSSQTGRTTVTVGMWTGGETNPETGQARGFQPTGLMERVSRQLEGLGVPQSRGAIDRAIKARREFILQAIDCLITDGYAIEDGPGTGGHPTVRLLRPYREGGSDPFPDLDGDDPSPETPSGGRTRSGPIGPGTTGTGTTPRPTPVPGTTAERPGTTPFLLGPDEEDDLDD
jgi:hypothetical protein